MINTKDILETISMIHEENLDIRTITMGISLYDCVSEDENRLCEKIYDKIVIHEPTQKWRDVLLSIIIAFIGLCFLKMYFEQIMK